jgi:hypothetical protein
MVETDTLPVDTIQMVQVGLKCQQVNIENARIESINEID